MKPIASSIFRIVVLAALFAPVQLLHAQTCPAISPENPTGAWRRPTSRSSQAT